MEREGKNAKGVVFINLRLRNGFFREGEITYRGKTPLPLLGGGSLFVCLFFFSGGEEAQEGEGAVMPASGPAGRNGPAAKSYFPLPGEGRRSKLHILQ